MAKTHRFPVRTFTDQGAQALWALGLALLPWAAARADEGGVPFWFSGQYASLAAMPATPGWSLPVQGYYYSGDASRGRSTPRGDSVTLDVRSCTSLILAQPTHAPDSKLFGGQLAVGVGFGYGKNTTQAGVSVSPRGTERERSDSVTGFTDPLRAVDGEGMRQRACCYARSKRKASRTRASDEQDRSFGGGCTRLPKDLAWDVLALDGMSAIARAIRSAASAGVRETFGPRIGLAAAGGPLRRHWFTARQARSLPPRVHAQ